MLVPIAQTNADIATDVGWLAVWTKPRAEKAVARVLDARAVTCWLPTIRVRRRWSDRWKEVDVPLFPGYLFAQPHVRSWTSLLAIPGVLTIVKRHRTPAWIREQQMTDLRSAVERVIVGDREPEIVNDFHAGDLVRVLDGPMAGLTGVVREIRGSRRLLVGLEQIGRALSLSIDAAQVERVAE